MQLLHIIFPYSYFKCLLICELYFLGYCLAVEEQGRKTLHTHILLFIKDWDELLDGLGNIEKREEYSKILTSYVDSISSNKMNELINRSAFKCESCMDSSSMIDECSDQCLRNLRTAKGSTEFGRKISLNAQTVNMDIPVMIWL